MTKTTTYRASETVVIDGIQMTFGRTGRLEWCSEWGQIQVMKDRGYVRAEGRSTLYSGISYYLTDRGRRAAV